MLPSLGHELERARGRAPVRRPRRRARDRQGRRGAGRARSRRSAWRRSCTDTIMTDDDGPGEASAAEVLDRGRIASRAMPASTDRRPRSRPHPRERQVAAWRAPRRRGAARPRRADAAAHDPGRISPRRSPRSSSSAPTRRSSTLAAAAGARPMLQAGTGLNDALRRGRERATALGADAVLVLPPDLVHVDESRDRTDRRRRRGGDRPVVVLVPDRHGRGTNALLLSPPDIVDFAFGRGSRQTARRQGATGRGAAGRARRAARARHRHARGPPPRRGSRACAPGPVSRVEVIGLEGIPEIRPGDDLSRVIGDALERTPGTLPLRRWRRPGRHPEGRLEGRGRRRRPADRRAATGGCRVGPPVGARRRARSRSSCARRAGSCGWSEA